MRSFRAICAAALLLLLLAGCAGSARALRPEPTRLDRTLVVLADRFHIVLAVPIEVVDEDLRAPLVHLSGPWMTLHFGERRWMTDPEPSWWHAAWLGLGGGEGLVEQDRLPALDADAQEYLGLDPGQVRIWRFATDDAGWAAWQAHLRRAWLAGPVELPPIPLPTVYRPTPRRWTLATNCHDFVIEHLAAAGVGLPPRLFRGARQSIRDLDRTGAR